MCKQGKWACKIKITKLVDNYPTYISKSLFISQKKTKEKNSSDLLMKYNEL